MSEHAPDRILAGIDIPKTIAGVLAAVSAAVIGSFLGVAGTLIGAAVASLIGSVGTEIYHRSIKKTHERVVGTFTTAPAAVGTPEVAAAADESPSAPPEPRRIHWKRVAMVAGALFVLAMGTLTAAELVAGKSIADATRGGNGDNSTISSIFSDKSGKSEKESPAVTPSGTPTTTPDKTEAPTPDATTGPSQSPATGTTEAPPTPDTTTDPGTGTESGSGSGTDSGTGTGTGTQDQGTDSKTADDGTK